MQSKRCQTYRIWDCLYSKERNMIKKIYQGKTGEVNYRYKITSTDSLTCIAVGKYDKELKRAYLSHDPHPFMNRGLPGFISTILSKNNLSDLVVCVTGDTMFDTESISRQLYL